MSELAGALVGRTVSPKSNMAKLRESWGPSSIPKRVLGLARAVPGTCEPGTPLRSKALAGTQDLESRHPGMNKSCVQHFLNRSGKRRFLQPSPGAFLAAGSPPHPAAWGRHKSPVSPSRSWGVSRASSGRQAAERAGRSRQGDAQRQGLFPRLLQGYKQAQGIHGPC